MYETNVRKIENAPAIIQKLTGCEFNRSDKNWETTGGLIATEVHKVLPHAINDVGEVNYAIICAALVEAVKELQSEVAELKNHRTTLKVPKR